MAKVKLLTPMVIKGKKHNIGDIVTISDKVLKAYLASKTAVEVKEDTKEEKKGK